MHKPLRAAEKEDVRQLLASKADATVVSFPKSGRTWLSFMLTYYTTRFLGHAEADNLFVGDRIADIIPDRRKDFITFVMSARTRRHCAPVVMFSHQREQIVPRLKTKRNVLLVRDPRDIIVSYFHHVVGRGKGRRLEAAGLGRRPTISSFLQLEDFGFDNLLKYLDRWTTWADRTGTPKLYFEDIVADPEEEFRKFLSAVG